MSGQRFWAAALLAAALSACSLPALTDASNELGDESKSSVKLSVLDYHVIPRALEINGLKVAELSALAWDEDEQLLYAVSDRGMVYHFRLVLENDLIKAVTPVFAAKLHNEQGKPLRHHDSEGVMVWNADNGKKGDSQLIISLEGEPRVIRFTPQGKKIASIKIPKALRDRKQYRGNNNGLESITYHPDYGFITAPEQPLKGQPKNLHTVYAEKKQWSFLAYPASNSSITALDVMPDNRHLLVMERAWSGFPNPLVISLRRIDLQACETQDVCEVENLKVFSSSLSVDNFEGMTHINQNRYLIVSDDGQNDLLRTLLTLFKIE